MSSGRIFAIFWAALLGASVGVCYQALRITGKPQEFRSLAKLVAGGQIATHDSVQWREQQADFYGTIIETLESAELKRRALERVRALNPGLKDSDVDIRVTQTKGSAIFNVLATGTEPKYIRIFLDALLDEFISFRQAIREQGQGKLLQEFLQAVVAQQKKMEDSMAMLEKVRARVDSLSAKSDLERLVARLNTLRNQRDDLHLELKPMEANDTARAPLEAKLSTTEQGFRPSKRSCNVMSRAFQSCGWSPRNMRRTNRLTRSCSSRWKHFPQHSSTAALTSTFRNVRHLRLKTWRTGNCPSQSVLSVVACLALCSAWC